MNSQAKILLDKYEKDLEDLQKNCLHSETEWMKNGFAPGHYYGEIKVCLNCWKRFETRP